MRTILVVDDSAPVRELVKLVLEEAGYAVLEAGNQQEAISAIQGFNTNLELVLCDIQLQGGSGFEIGNYLREKRPAAKILYMSGHDLRRQPAAGTEFIMKPFRPEQLIESIRRMEE